MSLYDDVDVKTRPTDNVSGWSSGIKLLQSQLQLKRATVTQPKRDQSRKASLAPVIDLKSKKDEDDIFTSITQTPIRTKIEPIVPVIPNIPSFASEYDWNVDNEYDPLWPNEYEKIVKELRDNRDRDTDKDEKRREKRRKSRFNDPEEEIVVATPQVTIPPLSSGFAGRWEEEEEEPVAKPSRAGGGVAIAPPPSLQEPQESPLINNKLLSNTYDGSSVAAKIMAKYGFKEGQGLGKQEQGMSMALQVEKTSKRGGRIIHEKEIMLPPPIDVKSEQSITEIMKTPGKVVLLRNMVGPGEVDDELEPEVKDECNTKYGDVATVTIHEVPNVEPEDAVRIFVEFRRIESAIKAVVDLNGRFFGGRQVKATFYDLDKFYNFQLME
ncbi:hypothetical protein PPYR_08997 [Photinus pyralis]|uniref:Splicing factor 45 n=1 Tax=Photinus pyralis TaxID=7054 RepID=A0A1Y1KY64_PHOPY|nr:splicing factor 45 [Photinus pyralis]KAB0798004.1 hypothetical protein PPYR_08997 [Photinus pyralis]